jgi:hypothetical protein
VSGGTFDAVHYRDPDGVDPVRAFLADLDDEVRAVLANQIDRLNLLSDEVPHLPFPHSSQVDGELRELRCHFGRQLYRVLFRRSDRFSSCCRSLPSAAPRSPPTTSASPQDRWDDFKQRMDATPRTPPRAAGHDAP